MINHLKTGSLLTAFTCAALSACGVSTHGKNEYQDPQSTLEAIFSFSSRAPDFRHDANDQEAEAARIKTLEQHLRANQMCLKGYTVTSRRVIVQVGERDQIDYVGRCTA